MKGSGFSFRLWFELQALEPKGKICSSAPPLGPWSPFLFSLIPMLSPESQQGRDSTRTWFCSQKIVAESRLNGASHTFPAPDFAGPGGGQDGNFGQVI